MPGSLVWARSILLLLLLSQGTGEVAGPLQELLAKSKSITQQKYASILANPKQHLVHRNAPTRGIIIAAGGSDQLANALATVQVLRNVIHTSLPIEVSYYGDEEADFKYLNALEELPEVKTWDASTRNGNASVSNGYLKKVLAIYYCKFDQFLYLDADNLPLIDPTELFEWPVFKSSGNVFWPDYMGSGRYESAKPEIYQAFNLKPPWESQDNWKCTESGQILFDRQKHADVLEWLLFLNSEHEIVYKYLYGDKDSFELAFHLSGKGGAFQRVPYGPRASFRHIQKDDSLSHTAMLQTDAKGMPLFFHQVAGGKYSLENQDLPVPAFISLGITESALDTMQWYDEFGTLRLAKDRAKQPSEIQCSDLDDFTAELFSRMKRSRWKSCKGKAKGSGTPILLLPVSAFPPYVSHTLTALLHSFRAIQNNQSKNTEHKSLH